MPNAAGLESSSTARFANSNTKSSRDHTGLPIQQEFFSSFPVGVLPEARSTLPTSSITTSRRKNGKPRNGDNRRCPFFFLKKKRQERMGKSGWMDVRS